MDTLRKPVVGWIQRCGGKLLSAVPRVWFLRPLVAAAALAIVVSGCSSSPNRELVAPDLSVLQPAEQQIEKARAVHADELAPDVLREAQRSLTRARSLLLQAALQGEPPSEAVNLRVTRLVEQARVDALLAIARTQRSAVGKALDEFENALEPEDSAPAPSAVSPAAEDPTP